MPQINNSENSIEYLNFLCSKEGKYEALSYKDTQFLDNYCEQKSKNDAISQVQIIVVSLLLLIIVGVIFKEFISKK